MRLGKKTSRAISIALLAAMASTSLPQVDVLAAVKNGMFLSVSYADKDKNDNDKEGTENTSPDESKQSEDAEPVQNEETGAASNSGVQENSEEQSSQNTTNGSSQNSAAKSNSSREISYNNGYSSYNNSYNNSQTSVTENPLTAGNRVSSFITLDKQAIGFTKVGDVVSVTASLSDDMDDEIVWRVADPTILLIKSTSVWG